MAGLVSLVNPAVLWLLVPLLGILVVLYLLKMRRKEFRVPATFLWPAQTYEIRANSLFQRLKFSWLLLLQAAALTLAVFALARPQIRSTGLSGEVTVLVLDTSASMAGTDVKPSRLEAAVAAAEKVVDSARPGDKVSLIEAGPTPRVLAPLSNDVGRLRLALKDVKPTDAQNDVGEALRLAASLVSRESSSRIILFSDGVFPEVADFAPGKAKVEFSRFGSSDHNSAVSALGITVTPQGPQAYCGLTNYSQYADAGVLNLYSDGDLVASRKVSIPPRATIGETFTVSPAAKVVEAKLDNHDDLDADNYAVALQGSSTLNVLLVGKGDLFLERAVSLDPRVVLYKAAAPPANSKYDVVVFDGVAETPVQALGVLTLGAAGPSTPVRILGRIDKPTPTTVKESPITKGVSLSGTFIANAQHVEPGSGGEVLASSSSGPLLIATKGAQRHLFLAFAPLDSDFPLQVSFPIFVSNALDFLAPKETTGTDITVAAGRTIALPAEREPLKIKTPQGAITVPPTNGQYVMRDLERVGKYELEGKVKRSIYVGFGDPAESNIAPVDHVLLGRSQVATTQPMTRLADWWKPLILAALLILAVEWWLYMWRS